MSASPVLPNQPGSELPIPVATEAFSLTVLVRTAGDLTTARAANLPVPVVEASTVREALSQIVQSAKQVIRENMAAGKQVPWIDPPEEPRETESRFMVPLHN